MLKADPRNKATIVKLENFHRLLRKGARRALYRIGSSHKRAANIEILRKPKGGRTYIRIDKVGNRRRHIASAPGETHANMTGTLRKSVGFKVHGSDQVEFGYGVGSLHPAPDYAEALEFGTPRVAARPTLQNTMKAETKNTIKNVEREIMRVIS